MGFGALNLTEFGFLDILSQIIYKYFKWNIFKCLGIDLSMPHVKYIKTRFNSSKKHIKGFYCPSGHFF